MGWLWKLWEAIYALLQASSCLWAGYGEAMEKAILRFAAIYKRFAKRFADKIRAFCKADTKAVPEQPVPEKIPEPIVQEKPKFTEDAVNDYVKQNPDIMINYLMDERAMKVQRKQMNARSLFPDMPCMKRVYRDK